MQNHVNQYNPDGLSKHAPVKQRRLDPHQVALICQLYEEGQTVYQVADEIGIHRQRVSAVLKRAGVELRRQSPSTEQISDMVRMYAQGLSTAAIGERLGFSHGTIWNQLRAAGVTLRDPHGRTVASHATP